MACLESTGLHFEGHVTRYTYMGMLLVVDGCVMCCRKESWECCKELRVVDGSVFFSRLGGTEHETK